MFAEKNSITVQLDSSSM